MNIGFIPARGGSKGIPGKNLVKLGSSTLLEIGIKKLERAGCEVVYVSTDSQDIAKQISGDDASTESAIQHFLTSIITSSQDVIILHQLTSPFIKVSSIKACIEIIAHQSNINSCFTALERHVFIWEKVQESEWRPQNHQRSIRIRRQELPERVIESGGIYAFRPEEFRRQLTRYAEPSAIVKIEYIENFEIDSPEELTEAILIQERFGDYLDS
jgi:CMP-N-acetylneuraminic acid synthetase